MQEPLTPRMAAENGIAAALGPLSPEDAMRAMIEVQATILSHMGIVPKTDEFEQFATNYLAHLCQRVCAQRTAIRAGAH